MGCTITEHITGHFTMIEPHNQDITNFMYIAQKSRAMDFEAPKL